MTAIRPSGGSTVPISSQTQNELPLARPMIAVARPERPAMKRYSKPTGSLSRSRGWLAQPRGMPDRADLGEVAAEGQARRPVDHRARLAGCAGDLAHVVGPRHPPGREAAA